MNNEAQELIAHARELIEREEYAEATALLDNAPADRSDWEAHETDEVACLVEFLRALTDEEMSMVRL